LPAQHRHLAAAAFAQFNGHQDAAPVHDLVEQHRRQIPCPGSDHRAVVGSAGGMPLRAVPDDDLDVPNTEAFQVRPALLRQSGDQLDPDHLSGRADQPAHDRCQPAGAGADLQHGLPRFQAEQVQQPQHVARLRVGRRQQLARSVHVTHDLVAVDGRKGVVRLGVEILQGTVADAETVDKAMPRRSRHGVPHPRRQALRHAEAPEGVVQHLNKPGGVGRDVVLGQCWHHVSPTWRVYQACAEPCAWWRGTRTDKRNFAAMSALCSGKRIGPQ